MFNMMAHGTEKNKAVKFLDMFNIIIAPDFMKIKNSVRLAANLAFLTFLFYVICSYVSPNTSRQCLSKGFIPSGFWNKFNGQFH